MVHGVVLCWRLGPRARAILSAMDALRKYASPRVITWLSLGLLLIASVYCAWFSNYSLAANSDDLVYPYLFQHFKPHDIVLPGQHSNILKFPLFALQALLPYNFTTFSLVNIGLVVATMLGWAVLLGKLWGRKYLPLICLSLSSVLLGSNLLSGQLLGTTIRNIEYPIALAFILYASKLLWLRTWSRREMAIAAVVGLLFSLTVAGDSFFLYIICGALAVTLAVFWFVGVVPAGRKKEQPLFGQAALYVAAGGLLAFVWRGLVSVLGIAKFYTADVFKPHILPLNHLGPSISVATTQVLDLFDANIFGQGVSPHQSLVFLNFFLLVLGVIGIAYMARDGFVAAKRTVLLTQTSLSRVFAFAAFALTCLLTFAVYIVSDLAVSENAAGVIKSADQERYLTMIPLLLVGGIVYLVWRYFQARRLVTLGLLIVVAAGLLISLSGIYATHLYDAGARQAPIAIAKSAQKNHIQLLITGYWYGASTKFWSHNQLSYASVAGCNIPQPTFNNRLSWYTPSKSVTKTALVVAHAGPDASYWDCSDAKLRSIYGAPTKVVKINTPDQPQLWIYNYDVRTKLQPFTY